MAQPAEQKATSKVRRSEIEFQQAKSILTKPSGFIDAFDFTLNPYSGCTFGCNYCYAANFANTDKLKEEWGKWVKVKENAIKKMLEKRRVFRTVVIRFDSKHNTNFTTPDSPGEGRPAYWLQDRTGSP